MIRFWKYSDLELGGMFPRVLYIGAKLPSHFLLRPPQTTIFEQHQQTTNNYKNVYAGRWKDGSEKEINNMAGIYDERIYLDILAQALILSRISS